MSSIEDFIHRDRKSGSGAQLGTRPESGARALLVTQRRRVERAHDLDALCYTKVSAGSGGLSRSAATEQAGSELAVDIDQRGQALRGGIGNH